MLQVQGDGRVELVPTTANIGWYALQLLFHASGTRCSLTCSTWPPSSCRASSSLHSPSRSQRCRLSWLSNRTLVIWAQMGGARGRGELRGLSQWVQLYTGAQIIFGDLTPYLTYGHSDQLLYFCFDNGEYTANLGLFSMKFQIHIGHTLLLEICCSPCW